jgi:uncharacterized delta-60 repeat protein
MVYMNNILSLLLIFSSCFSCGSNLSIDLKDKLSTYSQATGKLDERFGTSGIVKVSGLGASLIDMHGEYLYIASGNGADIVVTSINAETGSKNPNFGVNGIAIFDINGTDEALAANFINDAFYVSGKSTGNRDYVIKIKLDGTLDNTFSSDGIAHLKTGFYVRPRGVVGQSDGKILVTGEDFENYSTGGHSHQNNYTPLVARFNTDGSIDTTYGSSGYFHASGLSMQMFAADIDENDNVILAGNNLLSANDSFVIKVKKNGSLDTSFNSSGHMTINLGGGQQTSHIQSIYGNYVTCSGEEGNNSFLYLLNLTSGNLESSFGTNGIVKVSVGTNAWARAHINLPNKKYILLGQTGWDASAAVDIDATIFMYDEFGNLDTSFSDDGMMTVDLDGHRDFSYKGYVSEKGPIYIVISGVEADASTEQIGIVKII